MDDNQSVPQDYLVVAVMGGALPGSVLVRPDLVRTAKYMPTPKGLSQETWFETPPQMPPNVPPEVKLYPRPGSFRVDHETWVGTVDDLVAMFREGLEAAAKSQYEFRHVMGVDDEKYAEIQKQLAAYVGKHKLADNDPYWKELDALRSKMDTENAK